MLTAYQAIITNFFPDGFDTFTARRVLMDKKTKTQLSIGLFIIGIIMLFIPYLKSFDSIVPWISQYFSLMFYLGLLLIMIGYYLK